MLQDVFEVTDRAWRGIGDDPRSGWRLSADVPRVRRRAPVRRRATSTPQESAICRRGEVLQGLIKPHECAAFGTCARRATRSARRWSRPRARAPRTTCTAGSSSTPGEPASCLRPTRGHRLRRLGLPAAAARLPDDRDGPRRRRGDVRRAGRAPVPAGLRRPRPTPSWATPRSLDARRRPAGVLHRLVRGASRCSSPAATSATWRSTAPSTTWRCAAPRPLYLSTAFILEEGTALADIGRVAAGASGDGRAAAGVRLVTGDTKVVDAGHGDGVYVNTAGIGLVADGRRHPARQRAAPGDVVIVSGDIGVHGVAIMSCREGLEFGTAIESDTRAAERAGRGDARAPARTCTCCATRPGAAWRPRSTRSPGPPGSGSSLDERRPARSRTMVANACGLLGLDPLYVANEGKLVAFVAPRRRRRGARGDAGPPARRGGRGRSASASTSTPAWWWPGPASAAPGWSTCRSASSCPRIC